MGLETRVGVLMQRSADWIVALLGILKAGGVYVPLDGSYPTQRLRFMLEDAEVRLLLTESGQPEVVAAGELAEVVYLDKAWEWLGSENGENLENVTQAENLAYLMYTSGSTGQPKGVGVTHRAINRLVRNTNYVKFDESDRVAQTSNASFDVATFEIWGALLNGSQLVVLEKETVLSPTELGRQLVNHQISVHVSDDGVVPSDGPEPARDFRFPQLRDIRRGRRGRAIRAAGIGTRKTAAPGQWLWTD